jgi:hypothetical protein
MPRSSRRLVLPLAVVALALAGCTDEEAAASSPPPDPTAASPSTETAEAAVPTADAGPPAVCPTTADLAAVLPAPTPTASYTFTEPSTDCSGEWAVAFPTLTETAADGTTFAQGETMLFRWSRGAWSPVDRWPVCDAGQVPEKIYAWTCQTD